MYICIPIYLHAHTYRYIHIYAARQSRRWKRKCVRAYVCIYIYTNICLYIYPICTNVFTYLHMHIYIISCTCIFFLQRSEANAEGGDAAAHDIR